MGSIGVSLILLQSSLSYKFGKQPYIFCTIFNLLATDCAEAVIATNAGAERALKYIVVLVVVL